jgi:hypothetical protein
MIELYNFGGRTGCSGLTPDELTQVPSSTQLLLLAMKWITDGSHTWGPSQANIMVK